MTTRFQRLLGHGIAVADLDVAIASYERIGLALAARWTDPARGTTAARFALGDGGYVELIAVDDGSRPEGGDVAAFLAAGGDGLWRTDIAVSDLAAFAADEPQPGDAVASFGEVAEDHDGARRRAVTLADPGAFGGARFDLVEPAGDAVANPDTWWKRIFTEAVAVGSVDAAVAVFEHLDQPLWDRSGREEWGLDTAVFRQETGSNVEFVSPSDESRATGAAIAAFMSRRGGGHYMPVYEVDDVDAVADELDRRGVRTLGPPAVAPPESPWGPVRQMWVHPKLTHGAFVEFLQVGP